MASRKAAQIAASVLLVVGNLFMIVFLGTTILFTLSAAALPPTVGLILPSYIAFVSYKVGAVFGLVQILTEKDKRRWIVIVKICADIVFLLSGVISALISAVTLGGVVVSVSGQPVSTDQVTNQLAAILLSILGTVTGIHLFIIVATIGCYVSSLLVWNCSPCIKKMRQLHADRQKSSDNDIEMDSMNTK